MLSKATFGVNESEIPASLASPYLDKPEQWDELVRLCYQTKHIGYDSEFDGVDVGKQSCVGRARVVVFSIALPTSAMDPRGYARCRGWMLPAVALDYGPIRELLEDASVRKDVHNESVDSHSLANRGILLRGAVNTLGLVRWKRPELVNEPGRFKLKTLMSVLLGREPVCTFEQLISYRKTVVVTKTRTVECRSCSCGEEGCRKRKGHEKRIWTEEQPVSKEKEIDAEYTLEEISSPEHPRFSLLTDYAIEDSIAAYQTGQVSDDTPDPAPWPYGGTVRPGFDQRVEECVIDMERQGIPVDRPWAAEMVYKADEMELQALRWLRTFYRANVFIEKTDEEINAIWSSGPQKLALFDDLGFPRSPVWAKGKVKGDKAKLDWRAMEWIAQNHPASKPLIDKLTHLQRIRSGRKYLLQIRDSVGVIHPIAGPAGDEDDRSGAVTGRLGIKGELASQQLPKEGLKDLFGIRRGIVANMVHEVIGVPIVAGTA